MRTKAKFSIADRDPSIAYRSPARHVARFSSAAGGPSERDLAVVYDAHGAQVLIEGFRHGRAFAVREIGELQLRVTLRRAPEGIDPLRGPSLAG
jgi:hypothetical protein